MHTSSPPSRLRLLLFSTFTVVYGAEYGGIYLDPDMLIFRSFDPLRRRPLTLARESTTPVTTLSNGVIICRRGSVFMQLWLETYRTFNPEVWAYHSTRIPAR